MSIRMMLRFFAGLMIMLSLGQQAHAASYGTLIFPNGYSASGHPQELSFTFSATSPADSDDVVGLSVAAEATAPVYTFTCPTFTGYHFSGVQTAPNPSIGITLSQIGVWTVYCSGLYFVAGMHAFYLDNGESFIDGSLAFYGFF